MSRAHSFLYLLPEVLRTLLERRITVGFPFAPLEVPPYFRGKVTIDPELCVGCGQCVRDCPAAALELQRNNRNEFRLIYYPDRCAYCGQCETSCRVRAITLTNEFAPATTDRALLVETMVEREADEECPA